MIRRNAAWLWYAILWCPCYAISQVLFRYRFTGKSHVPLTGPVLLVVEPSKQSRPGARRPGVPAAVEVSRAARACSSSRSICGFALGAVPIDRERGALAGIRTTLELLKQDNAVLVFPEGSRTLDGKLHAMLPGFCLLARRSGATIVPVALDGAFGVAARRVFVRPHAISLAFGAPHNARAI